MMLMMIEPMKRCFLIRCISAYNGNEREEKKTSNEMVSLSKKTLVDYYSYLVFSVYVHVNNQLSLLRQFTQKHFFSHFNLAKNMYESCIYDYLLKINVSLTKILNLISKTIRIIIFYFMSALKLFDL